MAFLYEHILRPCLFQLETEKAHDLGVKSLEIIGRSRLARSALKFFLQKKSSPVHAFGLSFPNVIGQAAGLDKDGRFPAASEALGFGHIEVGTVTPFAQNGNNKPRLFRLPADEALVNRMGFNNFGAENLVKNLENFYPKSLRSIPLGINIGKGRETPLDCALDDYGKCFNIVAKQADYITVNISSPNTPDLRNLHHQEHLLPFLSGLRDTQKEWERRNCKVSPPCLIKISPDENFRTIENIIGLISDLGFDGVIACNTTINKNLVNYFDSNVAGGISGKPIGSQANKIIRFISKLTGGNLPIIGCGGVYNYDSAQEKLDAGATILQIYTGFIYKGPCLPKRLSESLTNRSNLLI